MITDDEMRFWSKVDKTGGCWEWTAVTDGRGYGKFWFDGRMVRAHRWSYEHVVGPIPERLQLDHLCRNRGCVNPEHLEPVTNHENTLRGVSHQAAKTHCPQGHLYDTENTYVDTHGGRNCRACRRATAARRKREMRSAA